MRNVRIDDQPGTTKQERMELLTSLVRQVVPLVLMIPPELIEEYVRDTSRWDTVAPILDPSAFMRDRDYVETGGDTIRALQTFQSELIRIRDRAAAKKLNRRG